MKSKRETGEGFAFRLFLGVLLTLLVAGGASYLLVSNRMRAELVEKSTAALEQAVDAIPATEKRSETRSKLRTFARELNARPDIVSVAIVDDAGRLIAGDFGLAGAATAKATRHGVISGGRGSEVLELVTNLRRADGTYTVVAERDAAETENHLVTMREQLTLVALPALLLSLGVFWLLSGRALHERHRSALRQATRDGLTGLGNHRLFQEELRKSASLAARAGVDFALAVFDVDDFKFLNDRRGHQHGDEVLRRIADILKDSRGQDRAFRTGGDEFSLLMPATHEHDAASVALRVRRLAAEAGISISGGVSSSRPDMRVAAVLREEAEAALQEGKRRRSGVPLRFSQINQQATILTPEKIHALRLLLNDGGIDVVMQPIWDVERGALLGVEGLSRPLPDYGIDGPAEAFDIAEQTGKIAELDRLCVNRILRTVTPQLPEGAHVFVNVHPASLDEGDEIGGGWLLEAVRAAGARPDQIVIEVTERSGARIGSLARAVARLRAMGLRVALDDVGAGNSGLELLHSIPVDFVKVDRAIVARAPFEATSRAALAAVAAFAYETGTHVIAEGIEDAEALDFVRTIEVRAPSGIRFGQGYGLGRPAASMAEAMAGGPVVMGQTAAQQADDNVVPLRSVS